MRDWFVTGSRADKLWVRSPLAAPTDFGSNLSKQLLCAEGNFSASQSRNTQRNGTTVYTLSEGHKNSLLWEKWIEPSGNKMCYIPPSSVEIYETKQGTQGHLGEYEVIKFV